MSIFQHLSAFEKGEKSPFNLYNIKPEVQDDNPDNPDNPDDPDDPLSPPPVTDDRISVSFTMVTHQKTWIGKHTVRLQKNTSVRDLITQVFDEYGVESKGLSTGYLRSVTYKGETLREFGVGRNSGWQYTVDGELPMLGITQYKLQGGEDVVLKFTADYTGGSVSGPTAEEEEKEEEVKEESAPESETVAYTDVAESDWFAGSVSFVSEKGFMTGVSTGEFAPQLTLTRAMFVTVLHRMAGKPEGAENEFSDVAPDAWYADAVSWAYANGIVSGTGADEFSPDAPITREQMATLIYRYALFAGLEGETDESEYSDGAEISPYAKEAVGFAEAAGIMQGSGGNFRPKDDSKRCEAAAVFERLYNATAK
ncbi:MAG: S-layer homology domain-containing protein [Oscillospiraceae bacterium]|nr:S-layer homology domain-containing protein [Oscillospiraceae bacterium]